MHWNCLELRYDMLNLNSIWVCPFFGFGVCFNKTYHYRDVDKGVPWNDSISAEHLTVQLGTFTIIFSTLVLQTKQQQQSVTRIIFHVTRRRQKRHRRSFYQQGGQLCQACWAVDLPHCTRSAVHPHHVYFRDMEYLMNIHCIVRKDEHIHKDAQLIYFYIGFFRMRQKQKRFTKKLIIYAVKRNYTNNEKQRKKSVLSYWFDLAGIY